MMHFASQWYDRNKLRANSKVYWTIWQSKLGSFGNAFAPPGEGVGTLMPECDRA